MRLISFSLLLALSVSADVITLKDGRVLEGEVLKEDDKSIKLKMSKGAITINRADIASIDRKLTPAQEYVDRVKKLDSKDAKARLELAAWASGKELEAEALEQYLAAWELDKTSQVARQELEKRDYHLEGGRWKSPDDYWPSRGYKKLDGKWYSPREYEWRVASRELERKVAARKAAEEAVTRAETNISAADGRARAERQKVDGMKEGMNEADSNVTEQKNEVNVATGNYNAARSNPVLQSSDPEQKKLKAKAEALVSATKNSLSRAQRDLGSAEKKLDDLKQGIFDGEARIEQIRVDREEAIAKMADLRAAILTTTEEANRAKTEADNAKLAWEQSK